MLGALAKGAAIGLSIAAPVGPIGVLCIQRTLAAGRRAGLVTGLGAATADGMYGAVAAYGLTFVSNLLVGQQFWFRLIGGIFLLYLGARTLMSAPPQQSADADHRSQLADYFSTVVLTLANPATILSFVAIFTGLGLAACGGDLRTATAMVVGVVSGSSLWWFILSGSVAIARSRLPTGTLRAVNAVSGLIVCVFRVIALSSILPISLS